MDKKKIQTPSEFYIGKHIAFKENSPPTEFQVAPIGVPIWTPSGIMNLSMDQADQIIQNFKGISVDGYIGYEHLILEDTEAPAAGWFKSIENRGLGEDGGIWATAVDWTPRAAGSINGKEYKYHSPVIDPHAHHWQTGEDIGFGLHSVGMTGTPRWKSQNSFVNKAINELNNLEEFNMPKLIELLNKTGLQLKDDASEDDIVKAVTGLITKAGEKPPIACKEVLDVLSLKDGATVDDIKTKVQELKDEPGKQKNVDPDPKKYVLKSEFDTQQKELVTTQKSVTDLQDKLALKDAEQIVDDEIAGKNDPKGSRITSAERDGMVKLALKDKALFDEMLKARPIIVPTGQIVNKDVNIVSGNAEEQIKAMVEKKFLEMKDKNVSKSDCFRLVQKENPELARQYLAERRS